MHAVEFGKHPSSLDECISLEKRTHYYQHRAEWFPGACCDAHAPEYVACRLAGKEWTVVHPCCVECVHHDSYYKCKTRSPTTPLQQSLDVILYLIRIDMAESRIPSPQLMPPMKISSQTQVTKRQTHKRFDVQTVQHGYMPANCDGPQ